MNRPSPHPRIRDAAVLLPLVMLFLLMPPMVTLFVGNARVAGVPLIVAYVFGVWLVAIACAAWLARRLAPPPAPPPEAPGTASLDTRPDPRLGDDASFG